MKNSKFNSLNWTLLKLAILPMILLMLIVSVAGTYFVNKSLTEQVFETMEVINNTIESSFDAMYDGAYSYEEKEDGIHFYKGDHEFNDDFSYIDSVKASSDCDISVCYLNYAVITTLVDGSLNRRIGAGESMMVYKDVIEGAAPHFYDNAYIGDEKYYAYYSPLFGADGEVVGMIGVAKSASLVNKLVGNAIAPILIIDIISFILISILVLRYSNGFVAIIKTMQGYMKAIADGEFRTELNPTILKRTDEIGDMAKSATQMASALRVKVEEDQLTGLYNRRSADKKIKRSIRNYVEKGVKFSLAIGDIDFFKKVNDTYGHEAGDDVLQAVSYTLKTYMAGKGYAIRWGGEEFLLIFEDKLLDETRDNMEEILNQVRALEIVNNNQLIKVTMTFGLVDCTNEVLEDMPDDESLKDRALKMAMDNYISSADKKLYYGKEHGRNQLVHVDLASLEDGAIE